MAFNGSGTFSLPAGNPVSGVSNSSVHNTTNSEIAAALTNCITRDGQSPATANIPMGTHKLTGLSAGTSPGDSLRYEQGAKLAGDTFTGLVTLAAGADIASSATTDLTAATGNFPRITGTTPTSAVTLNTGQPMVVVADGAWPLTYHATTNKLNTGENYTCSAGDIILYYKDLSGVVHGTIFPVEPLVDYSASSTIVGWTSFTTKEIYTRKRGKQLFVHFKLEGVSNSVNTTFTIPYTTDARQYSGSAFVVDNTTSQSGPGYLFVGASGSTVTIYKDFASTSFTASGTKQVRGQFVVNIA